MCPCLFIYSHRPVNMQQNLFQRDSRQWSVFQCTSSTKEMHLTHSTLPFTAHFGVRIHLITNWRKQIQIKLDSSTFFSLSEMNNYYEHLCTLIFERKPISNQNITHTQPKMPMDRHLESIPIDLCKRTKANVNIFGQ